MEIIGRSVCYWKFNRQNISIVGTIGDFFVDIILSD